MLVIIFFLQYASPYHLLCAYSEFLLGIIKWKKCVIWNAGIHTTSVLFENKLISLDSGN